MSTLLTIHYRSRCNRRAGMLRMYADPLTRASLAGASGSLQTWVAGAHKARSVNKARSVDLFAPSHLSSSFAWSVDSRMLKDRRAPRSCAVFNVPLCSKSQLLAHLFDPGFFKCTREDVDTETQRNKTNTTRKKRGFGFVSTRNSVRYRQYIYHIQHLP